ncbi:MAG: extracellular solute-binding protein [Synergistaceae bacterium]|nr:extracellular solute-binding protein [Synergistaceae bacterium]
MRKLPTIMLIFAIFTLYGASAAFAGVTELTFATSLYVEEPHQVVLDKLLAKYNETHPNVKITIYGSEYANFWNNLTTEIISGNEADIVQITPDVIASYNSLREGGAFVELSPYMQKTGKPYAANLVGQDLCMLDGRTVALANYAWGTTGVFYRKSMLEKAGVNPESIKNSDDFVKALKTLTKGDAVGMGVVVSAHSFVVDEWIRMFARAVSGGVYFPGEAPPYDAEHIAVNSPENIWMAKWWQELILKDRVFKPGPDKKDARELFWNGLAAFNLDGPWFIGMTEQRDPAILADTGLIPHPDMIYNNKSYKQVPDISPYIAAISTKSKDIDAAWDFIDWMTSDEAQEIIAECGMTPNSRSYSETEAYKTKYPLSYKFITFLSDVYGKPMQAPNTEKYSELHNAFVQTGQNMFGELGADPKTELDALAVQMKEIMNR